MYLRIKKETERQNKIDTEERARKRNVKKMYTKPNVFLYFTQNINFVIVGKGIENECKLYTK